ncbi:MAG: zinc ribbon domain-containing protein, partial [Verrucomicrobiota bacterium]|nr:zinc ribbon domain-containing protein [Verrucomicrobiota bacterium]
MTTATAIKLICPDCRFENEAERIYCHECGARLDRSPLSAKKLPVEDREQTLKRVRGMFDQRKAKIRLWCIQGIKMIIGAAAMAGVVLAVLPPDIPPVAKSAALPAQISLDLETMIAYRRPPELRYSEDTVNAYIANALRNKKDKLSYPLLTFERAHVKFFPGRCRVMIARSLFGYPLYTVQDCNFVVHDGRAEATSTGGAIGRLPIHPEAMKYSGILFADVVHLM